MTERRPAPGSNVFFRFFRTGQTIRRLMLLAVEGSGVTQDEYGVLSSLRAVGPMPPTEMASWLGMPPTTVSTYVSRFLERGLVERRPNPEDGRSYLLALTPAGDAVITTVAPRLTEVIQAVAAESPVPLTEIADGLATLDAAGRRVLDSERLRV